MEIEFERGPDGLTEAESVYRIVHHLPETSATKDVAAALEHRALDRLGGDAGTRLQQQLNRSFLSARVRALKARLFGPSARELELGLQRSEALERANRAEKASFEALADMAAIERERDAALEKIESLKREIDELRRG